MVTKYGKINRDRFNTEIDTNRMAFSKPSRANSYCVDYQGTRYETESIDFMYKSSAILETKADLATNYANLLDTIGNEIYAISFGWTVEQWILNWLHSYDLATGYSDIYKLRAKDFHAIARGISDHCDDFLTHATPRELATSGGKLATDIEDLVTVLLWFVESEALPLDTETFEDTAKEWLLCLTS